MNSTSDKTTQVVWIDSDNTITTTRSMYLPFYEIPSDEERIIRRNMHEVTRYKCNRCDTLIKPDWRCFRKHLKKQHPEVWKKLEAEILEAEMRGMLTTNNADGLVIGNISDTFDDGTITVKL